MWKTSGPLTAVADQIGEWRRVRPPVSESDAQHPYAGGQDPQRRISLKTGFFARNVDRPFECPRFEGTYS
jgi:hypothetical protein